MNEFLAGTPRYNQHLHLTGALDKAYLLRSCTESVREFGNIDPTNFDAPEMWALAKHVTSTPQGFESAVDYVVKKQHEEGVVAVELTVNPYGMIRRGMTHDEISHIAPKAVENAQNMGVSLSFKLGVNRKDGPDSIGVVKDVYRAMPDDARWGIDLNGDERVFPTLPFLNGFSALMDEGIFVSIHAGEFPDEQESLRQAMSIRPQRIGHAVSAIYNNTLLNELAHCGSTVEVAISSNIARGVVVCAEEHPIRQFHERGIPFVFGTDDPAFFGNTIDQEYDLARRAAYGQV